MEGSSHEGDFESCNCRGKKTFDFGNFRIRFGKNDEGGDVFAHHSAIKMSGFKTLTEGDRVTLDIEQGRKGLAAADVNKI